MTSTEADLFLKSVLAAPGEPLRRLVFADWLEETGTRSNIAWAKYLRLADEITRLDANDPTRTQKVVFRERLSPLIQAKLRVKAEAFFSEPNTFRLILPARCFVLDIETFQPSARALETLPESVAREMNVLPLYRHEQHLVVASGEVLDAEAKQALRFILDTEIESILVPEEQFAPALDRIYADIHDEESDTLNFSLNYTLTSQVGPVPRIVEMILSDATEEGVRDIRIQRAGPRIDVRFIRGAAEPLWGGFPHHVHLPLVEYLLRLAALSTDAIHLEQSGIFRFPLAHRVLDVALRTIPTRSGPQVHLTILPHVAETPSAAMRVA